MLHDKPGSVDQSTQGQHEFQTNLVIFWKSCKKGRPKRRGILLLQGDEDGKQRLMTQQHVKTYHSGDHTGIDLVGFEVHFGLTNRVNDWMLIDRGSHEHALLGD